MYEDMKEQRDKVGMGACSENLGRGSGMAIIIFKQQSKLMSSNTHKNQIQSLSSLSLEHNLKNLTDSQLFPRQNRKSSFEMFNMLNESQPNGVLQRSKLQKSLDMLNSSLNLNKLTLSPLQDFLQFTEDDRYKFNRAGIQPSLIDQIDSQEDSSRPEGQPTDMKMEEEEEEEADNNYTLVQYLPEDLAKLLQEKQIPLEYVRGLLLVNQKQQIKSIRRLKVERYLEKRRKKTWDKKICYNCRQKVAQQRLRIKGKFIKKRRAMQILGLSTPISTVEIKEMLEEMLKDKTLKEIEEIIRKEEPE